jgi:cysteine-rich repeat protein
MNRALAALVLLGLAARPAFAVGLCGNGVLDSAEACDDGDTDAGDGCGTLCTVEPGWACPVAGQDCDALFCETARSGAAVLLRGNYIEVGLNPNAAFGAGTESPDGWHARPSTGDELGLVSDPEASGWSARHGDFFLPGSAEEGWSLEVDGQIASNNRNASFELAGTFAAAQCLTSGACGARGGARAVWRLAQPFHGVSLLKQYTLVDGGTFVLVDVVLTNTTSATLSDVYYLRTIDPDNDQTLHGEFETTNEILSEPDGDSTLAHVRASQSVDDIDSAFSMLADDARARVSFGGFANRIPHDVWQGTPTLKHVGGAFGDQAVSIAFQLELPAGARRSLRYALALSPDPTGALSCVLDQDADGVIDLEDTHPADAARCSDRDEDGCEDCSSGHFAPDADGDDGDADGACDLGDEDDDDDGVADEDDGDPSDAAACLDSDDDGCDDCALTGDDGSGGDPDHDGLDADGDGVCDVSDSADDDLPDAGPTVVIEPIDAGPSEAPPQESEPTDALDETLDAETLPSENRVSFSGGGGCVVAPGAPRSGGLSIGLGALLVGVGVTRRRRRA